MKDYEETMIIPPGVAAGWSEALPIPDHRLVRILTYPNCKKGFKTPDGDYAHYVVEFWGGRKDKGHNRYVLDILLRSVRFRKGERMLAENCIRAMSLVPGCVATVMRRYEWARIVLGEGDQAKVVFFLTLEPA